MIRIVKSSLLLIAFTVVICCTAYPLVVWGIAQTIFPDQANGSLVIGPDGTPVGSRLIAQPFTKDEYFQPRPSAASYDASASASSTLAPSNYLLRNRAATIIGPVARYETRSRSGQLVGIDIEAWFQKDVYQGKPGIVAQWAEAHNAVAQSWVKVDPSHGAYVDEWAKAHPDEVAQWKKANPDVAEPASTDLAVVFFESFSKGYPGKFPSAVQHETPDGKSETAIEPVAEGTDIQSAFFDMWRQEHPNAEMEPIPGDMVTASGSGLDPHITLENAMFQLDRVSAKWAENLHRDPDAMHGEIRALLEAQATAPFGGLIGEKLVNVLEVNLALRARYGAPPA